MKTSKSAQRAVDRWNAKHPIGTLVNYWTFVRELDPPKTGRTRSRAEVLGGHTAVVWIEGCRGCVALSHVDALT